MSVSSPSAFLSLYHFYFSVQCWRSPYSHHPQCLFPILPQLLVPSYLFPGLCSTYLRQHTSQTECQGCVMGGRQRRVGTGRRVERGFQLNCLSPVTRVMALAGESRLLPAWPGRVPLSRGSPGLLDPVSGGAHPLDGTIEVLVLCNLNLLRQLSPRLPGF